MTDELKALRDIISSSIDGILNVCEAAGTPFPSLNDPVRQSEVNFGNDPAVARLVDLVVSASTQLIATVQHPPTTLKIAAFRSNLPAALGVVEAGNVAEILRNAGPQGLHVDEIASKSNMDPKKLVRVLRYLATEHWFREISPNIFANNKLSSLLDTGKELTECFDKLSKYDNEEGLASVAGSCADEHLKTASYLVEMMTDPITKFSEEPNYAAVQKALNMNETFFEFLDRPTEEYRRKRFAAMMVGYNRKHGPTTVLPGFDWGDLPEGGMIVDVGGGFGHVSLEIAREYPKLRVVIEDRPLVVEQAKLFWEANLPSHVAENKVHFIGCDFFEEQPKLPGAADVFLLRHITHDWSDKYAINLLRQLRNAASPKTKLVIVDNILGHVCGSGQEDERPPFPLLPNMGGANLLMYLVDVAVFGAVNAGERTIEDFNYIIAESGWKLREIRRNPASYLKSVIICKPA